MDMYKLHSPHLDRLLVLRRICDRGRDYFYHKKDNSGIDLFEHLGQEIERLAVDLHKEIHIG